MKFRRKASKTNFDISFLPHNRKDAFKDVVKNRFSLLIKLGLILLLFSIPYFISFAFKYYGLLPTARDVLTPEEYGYFKLMNAIMFDGINVVSFICIAVGIAGISVIVKKLCWHEGIFFWHDFKTGIKENGWHFAIIAFIFSILRFAAITFSRFDFPPIVRYIPLSFFYIFAPVFMMSLSIDTFYTTKIFASLRDGFQFVGKKIVPSLLFALFFLAERLIHVGISEYAPGFIFLLNLWEIVVIIVVLPIYILGWVNFSLSQFDTYVNQRYNPKFYHRGLVDSDFYKDVK